MAYQYIVGVGVVLIAAVLGFVFLYYNSFRRLKKTTRTGPGEVASGTTDIIIVGYGVAGAALAFALGKDGRRVLVIERDFNEIDRIAGEGLLPGGYRKLLELGLEDCVNEIDAQEVHGYVLYKDGKEARLTFPLQKYDQSHVVGRTFHNGRFVQRLREKAASVHNVSLEQGTVTSLLEENGTVKGVHYKNKSGHELTAYAPLTIVCDGSFSTLRRSLCEPKVDIPSYFVGFILKNCEPPLANFAAFMLEEPSLILFYSISSNELRCLVDVPCRNVPSVSEDAMTLYLKTQVAPKVPLELYTAYMSGIENWKNIKIMQNRIMHAAPNPTPGAILIGDSFNMRHPVTGGGMTVALSDVVVLRDLLRPLHNLHDAYAVCKYLESFYTLRKPMASTINTLANTLHKVLSAPSDPAMEAMQEACFGYLRLGRVFSDGLAALISGLYPRPLSLALHFFAMAVYGAGRLFLPFPSPKRMWSGAKLILVAVGTLFPIIKSEGIREMFFPQTVPAYYRTPPFWNEDI
ncbi:hypothetical protein PTKIN_Ptkin10aG0181000 [Pterospermum kingtungense]